MEDEDVLLFFDQPWETKTIVKEDPKMIYNTPIIEKKDPEKKQVKFTEDLPKFTLLSMPNENFEMYN
jgi:hypothetical protein